MQKIRPDLTEPQVVLPLRNLAAMWQQLFPAEQCRLVELLIERVLIADGGLEIIWRDQGWHELAGELLPGSIGAELQEWEQIEEIVSKRKCSLWGRPSPANAGMAARSSCRASSR
jgi:hypothetical protein